MTVLIKSSSSLLLTKTTRRGFRYFYCTALLLSLHSLYYCLESVDRNRFLCFSLESLRPLSLSYNLRHHFNSFKLDYPLLLLAGSSFFLQVLYTARKLLAWSPPLTHSPYFIPTSFLSSVSHSREDRWEPGWLSDRPFCCCCSFD